MSEKNVKEKKPHLIIVRHSGKPKYQNYLLALYFIMQVCLVAWKDEPLVQMFELIEAGH